MQISLRQFDFRRNWKRLCLPHVQHPSVQRALNRAMEDFCWQRNVSARQYHPKRRRLSGRGPCCAERETYGYCQAHGWTWVPGDPPVNYSIWGEAAMRKSRDLTKLSAYQLLGGCHWIADFVEALAKRMFPDDVVERFVGAKHTVVICHQNELLMDILLFDEHTATESFDYVCGKFDPAAHVRDRVSADN